MGVLEEERRGDPPLLFGGFIPGKIAAPSIQSNSPGEFHWKMPICARVDQLVSLMGMVICTCNKESL